MKLDKMKFARVIAHCVSNGMTAGEHEVNTLDELIDIEPVDIPICNVHLEALMSAMANGTSKIDAIKHYRALTAMPLKDSKDIVERYWISETTPKKSAKELQVQMLDVLSDDRCMIKGEALKETVRDFISSFSSYS